MLTRALGELCQIELITKLKVPVDLLSKEFKKGYSTLINDLTVDKKKIVYSEVSYFSLNGILEGKQLDYSIQKEDILLFKSKGLQVGISAEGPLYFNKSTFIRIRCLQNVTIPCFMSYFLEHKKEKFEDFLSNTIDQSFCEKLKKWQLTIPNVQEQQKICELLQQFDELLDCLKKKNELRERQLEILKEKLFDSDDTDFF